MPHKLLNPIVTILKAAVVIMVAGWILDIPGRLQIGLQGVELVLRVGQRLVGLGVKPRLLLGGRGLIVQGEQVCDGHASLLAGFMAREVSMRVAGLWTACG